MELLKDLQKLGLEKIIVRHKPMTTRYLVEASSALRRVLAEGILIGWREIPPLLHQSFEVVIWVDPFDDKPCGIYCCLRMHYGESGIEGATMFCFYNGKDKSPCYEGKDAAIAAMETWSDKNKVKYNR